MSLSSASAATCLLVLSSSSLPTAEASGNLSYPATTWDLGDRDWTIPWSVYAAGFLYAFLYWSDLTDTAWGGNGRKKRDGYSAGSDGLHGQVDLTEALEAAMEHMKEMDWEAILDQEDMYREGFEYIDDDEEYEEDDGEFLKLEETKGKDGFFDEDYKSMSDCEKRLICQLAASSLTGPEGSQRILRWAKKYLSRKLYLNLKLKMQEGDLVSMFGGRVLDANQCAKHYKCDLEGDALIKKFAPLFPIRNPTYAARE